MWEGRGDRSFSQNCMRSKDDGFPESADCRYFDESLTLWLMELGGSMPHNKGSPIIPILNRINPMPRIDTYFFKIHSTIFLPYLPRSS